jgi:hypothetical protein
MTYGDGSDWDTQQQPAIGQPGQATYGSAFGAAQQPPAPQWQAQAPHQVPPQYGPPQPGYQYPAHRQPGAPPPGYAQQWQQPQPFQPSPRPPAKKSRVGLWIGLGVGAAVLILLVVCGGAFLLLQSRSNPVAGHSTPSSQPASRPASNKPASAVTMVRPDKIGGRNRITTGEYATKAARAEESLKTELKPGGSLVVAYYGTTDRKVDQIYIVASTIPGPLKKATFDKQFENTGPSIGGQPTANVVEVPVGTLGGFMKCGQTTQDGMDVAVCAFSNEYDYAVVQWYNRKLSEDIKKELVTIRTLLER